MDQQTCLPAVGKSSLQPDLSQSFTRTKRPFLKRNGLLVIFGENFVKSCLSFVDIPADPFYTLFM